MIRTGTPSRRLIALTTLLASTLLLGACSLDDTSETRPTVGPTAVTMGPDDVAVGRLLDDGAEAWAGVRAWRAETHSEATPGEGGITSSTTETVILPGQRHILTMNGETVVTEEIALDGTIYMRGALVSSSIYPGVDAGTWIRFPPDQAPAGSALEQEVAFLTTPPHYPFADFTADTRRLPASPAGEARVGERTCEAWTFSTTTAEQAGIDYTIAFDADHRPCQLVRESGGVIETTIWTYPTSPEPIKAPADATPVEAFPGQDG